jgi:hypothetical protein
MQHGVTARRHHGRRLLTFNGISLLFVSKTTEPYDRTVDQLDFDEIEKIRI